MGVTEDRLAFAAGSADAVAQKLGLPERARKLGRQSARFNYFGDEERLLLVVGPQEADYVHHALPVGLGLAAASGRRLQLALPKSAVAPSIYRSAWRSDAARPSIWTFDQRGTVSKASPTSRAAAIESLKRRAAKGDVVKELAKAATATYLGDAVAEITDWATGDERLDPAHRQGERAWHFRGQRVLSIRRSAKGGFRIRAGIHYSDNEKAPLSVVVDATAPLLPKSVQDVHDAVEGGISKRMGGKDRKVASFDEHWLQSVIRRDPALIGIEQPALREFPAWRPAVDAKGFGRGFIDLLGLDGQGTIRIAEAKVDTNLDPMFVLQGLDYYIWAHAYEKPLRARLGAASGAPMEIDYVVGARTARDTRAVLTSAAPVVAALADDVRWRFQIVTGWDVHTKGLGAPARSDVTVEVHGVRTLPAAGAIETT